MGSERAAKANGGGISLETLIRGVCEKTRFLDLAENFTLHGAVERDSDGPDGEVQEADRRVQPKLDSTTPGVCGGDPCIRYTRHTVAGLVQWRKLNLTGEQILRHHPDLDQRDLDAAWQFYQEHAKV